MGPSPRWLPVAILAAGCVEVTVISDYVLQLEPRHPPNLAPFESGPSVSLVFRDAQDNQEFHALGDMQQGSRSLEELPALNQTRIGLLLQEPGTDGRGFDPESLVAWGEVGPITLGGDGEEVSQPVLVLEPGKMGELGVLERDHAAMLGAAAMLPSGDVFLFGGAGSMITSTRGGYDHILQLHDLDGGTWRFEEVAKLPDLNGDGDPDTRVGHTATLVEVDGGPQILVTGGRPRVNSLSGNTSTAFLFDPAALQVVWSTDAMGPSRSQHRAVALENGRVLIAGGLRGDGEHPNSTSVQIFDPEARSFSTPVSVAYPATGFGITGLGGLGVMMCGGAILGDGNVHTSAQNPCSRVSLTGSVQHLASLPVGLQWPDMVRLADGRVLVTGGVTATSVGLNAPAAATDRAWIYDTGADSWQEIDRMVHPRAMHRSVRLLDGRVLIFGGSDQASLFRAGDPVPCAEIFDPADGTFSLAEPCSSVGAGMEPVFSAHRDHGALLFEGWYDEGNGGQDYGIVGLGAPL